MADKEIKDEIERLHGVLEARGINSRGTADIFGRVFNVPVDAEHKCTKLGLGQIFGNISNPHMRAFHTSWFGFFSSFFSTFAAAPLVAYIKDDLNLEKADIGNANIASVAGTIVFRLMMGWICDKLGARRGLGFLLLGVTPAIVGITFTTNATGFIICRCFIGFGLATFVACQVWCSQMFAKSVVGVANATAAGWGNLGGGVTNLVMPFIFLGFLGSANDDPNLAWRLCYIVPLALHICGGLAVLTGRDLPDGNYSELETSGAKQKTDSKIVLRTGVTNVNAWILTITYGFCFGVELTMNNVAALYFYTYQGQTPQIAGIAASCFGLMNLFARSVGGIMSDMADKKYGMRGRLWACWIIQTIEGVMCCVLGSLTTNLDSPFEQGKVRAAIQLPDEAWRKAVNYSTGWTFVDTCPGTDVDTMITQCGTKSMKADDILKSCFEIEDKLVLLQDPPRDGMDCISHSDTFGLSIIIVILFSFFVQAAEGLHFGIVPQVSRPALGIVSGMVGAGGNLGSVIATSIFFRGRFRTDEGVVNLGIMIIAITLLMFGIYFPDKGGLLFKAGSIPYDPQLVKPPEDYRGADSMNYAAAKTSDTKKGVEDSQA